MQIYASERVARDLRTRIVDKLATQDLAYFQRVSTATLLTNLTADVDAVKLFVSQAVGSLVSSVFLIIGASILLLSIDWKLGLAVLGGAADHRRHLPHRARPGAEAVHEGDAGGRSPEHASSTRASSGRR